MESVGIKGGLKFDVLAPKHQIEPEGSAQRSLLAY